MKKGLLLLLLSVPCFAEGPRYRHQDKTANLEFQNVYQDLRNINAVSSTTLPSGSTEYIQNRTTEQTGATSYPTTARAGTGGVISDYNIEVSTPGNETVRKITVTWDKDNTGTHNVGGFEMHNNDQASAGSGYRVTVDGNGRMVFVALGNAPWTGTTNIITATAPGEINKPLQPSFLATDGTGATDVTGDGTVYTELWPTEIYDQGSDFTSNTFTAPVTGRYLLTAAVRIEGVLTTHTSRLLRINTSNRSYDFFPSFVPTAGGHPMINIVIADMDAGDTAIIQVYAAGGTKVVDIPADAGANYFSGSLIN